VALSEVSRATGITIVAGTGFYLDPAIPADVRDLAPEQIAETILADLFEGENGIRPGFIGEIGVGADFTAAERASLAGACIAQRETGLPMQVHLPGWFRLGGDVLDVVESHGVDPARVVLCHMGPSGADLTYQEGLLERGVFVQYDMLGMEVFYADQGVQCPSDEQNAEWLARLVERGHADRLLLSQDIFLKSLLRRHGGPGYGHVLQYFVPRLNAAGLDSAAVEQLMVANPRALFEEPNP
jgi:phosphotriesterase-related protein